MMLWTSTPSSKVVKRAGHELNNILLQNKKYGYEINITHPKIYPLYVRFKEWKSIPTWCPLSDNERFEFEEHIKKSFKID